MVKYQFDVPDELWRSWKETVPRSKSLDTRLRELIQADRDGYVRVPPDVADDEPEASDVELDAHAHEPPAHEPEPVDVSEDIRARLEALDFPAPQAECYTREDRVELLGAVYERLENADGEWVTRDDLRNLYTSRPAGYSSEDSWYERFVRKFLLELPEVEKRGRGASGMRLRRDE